jgi:predicted P-loop ATPase
MSIADKVLNNKGSEKPSKSRVVKAKNPSKLQLIEIYLKKRYDIRFNTVSCIVEYKIRDSKERFKELDENSLYVELENNRFDIAQNKLKALLHSNRIDRFNPFTEYFNSLPQWHKEREKDFIELLCAYIPTKAPERFKMHFRKMLVRSIACALDDSVFNKQAFILVHSKQSSGKSTFCRWLCPDILKGYFAENINTDKDSLIALASNFIINMDELATLSRTDLNSLKSFLSKDSINVRLPYEARVSIKPRRANFVGSTNKDEFLTDETGSVRWLCFELTDNINFDYSKDININDIWRQAYSLYKSGFPYQLTTEEIAENEKANKQYFVNTPEMDLIPKLYRPATKEKHDEFLNSTDIQNQISIQFPHIRLTAQAIGKALVSLGFIKCSEYNEDLKYSQKGYYIFKTDFPTQLTRNP